MSKLIPLFLGLTGLEWSCFVAVVSLIIGSGELVVSISCDGLPVVITLLDCLNLGLVMLIILSFFVVIWVSLLLYFFSV